MSLLLRPLVLLLLLCSATGLHAQQRVNPVIPSYGGIYAIPEATVRPDSSLNYRIVVDVAAGAEHPDSLARGFYLVARMMNLFAVGGIPDRRVEVVLAIHGGATFGVLDHEHYRARFGRDNPNLDLLRELREAGVRLTVCGQSLVGRGIPTTAIDSRVELATSMLTTVAMYQMRGYGLIKF